MGGVPAVQGPPAAKCVRIGRWPTTAAAKAMCIPCPRGRMSTVVVLLGEHRQRSRHCAAGDASTGRRPQAPECRKRVLSHVHLDMAARAPARCDVAVRAPPPPPPQSGAPSRDPGRACDYESYESRPNAAHPPANHRAPNGDSAGPHGWRRPRQYNSITSTAQTNPQQR